ncbi:MAG: WxcM-like domain-containing protein [bacterium]
MEWLSPYTIFEDERGIFFGITNKHTWKEINLIRTIKNVTRGGHYHKFTKELFYIVEGDINVEIYNIKNSKKINFKAKSGDVFIVNPYEVHTFKVNTDSIWINMLSHVLNEDSPDIYRYDFKKEE